VIVKAVDQWRTRLRTCVTAKGHHFEYVYKPLIVRRDLTGRFQSHSQFSEEDYRSIHFMSLMFSQLL